MFEFYGLPTAQLTNEFVRLDYLTSAGPRIVRLIWRKTGENLLAELPNFTLNSIHGAYHIRGGHRLWHAPEASARTYVPDDEPITIEPIEGGARLLQTTEKPTGIAKSIAIQVDRVRPKITITHTLRNNGLWPIELAPWAITQLPLGGIATLPQQTTPLDPEGFLPNRTLVLWPYTYINDSRLKLGDTVIEVDAHLVNTPMKIGYFNRASWFTYERNGIIFRKRFEVQSDTLPYPDNGCNCEVYVNDQFIELETLAPLTKLEPNMSVSHEEVWEIEEV